MHDGIHGSFPSTADVLMHHFIQNAEDSVNLFLVLVQDSKSLLSDMNFFIDASDSLSCFHFVPNFST
jgi:hypothetical protein